MKRNQDNTVPGGNRELSPHRSTLEGHLAELRRRLLAAVGAVAVASIFCYRYREFLLTLIARPVQRLVFIQPTEALFAYLKISLCGGFFLALPFVLYQMWRFIIGGLTIREYRSLRWLVPFSYMLFLSGSAFALGMIIPAGMRFLLTFQGPQLTPFLSVRSYLHFVFFLTVGSGSVFQLPLVFFFLARMGVLNPRMVAAKRPLAVVVILTVAAVLSPGPDVITQLLLAVPLYLLFEISLVVARLATPVKTDDR